MHTVEHYAPPRGSAAVMAIAIQSVLVYLLAVGLNVVPNPVVVPNATLVTVPTEIVQKPRVPIETPDRRDLSDAVRDPTPMVKPFISIEENDDAQDNSGLTVGPRVEPRIDNEPAFAQARVLNSLEPPYPNISRLREEEGTVYVRITLSPRGQVADVQLDKSSGFARLDDAALKAVRSWRFAPATRGGQGVTTSVVVPVKFVLHGRG